MIIYSFAINRINHFIAVIEKLVNWKIILEKKLNTGKIKEKYRCKADKYCVQVQ
jgi:hypothetical protein